MVFLLQVDRSRVDRVLAGESAGSGEFSGSVDDRLDTPTRLADRRLVGR